MAGVDGMGGGPLVPGTSPEDFIARNLERLRSTQAPAPAAPAVPAMPPVQPIEQDPFDLTTPAQPVSVAPPAPVAPAAPALPAEPALPEPVAEPEFESDDDAEPEHLGPRESLKALRKTANELKADLASKTALLERYKKGETVPAVLAQKEDESRRLVESLQARNNELQRYEQLHALKLSPQYQAKYVQPMSELNEKALNLAKDYDVPPDVLNEALRAPTRREQNTILHRHFDTLGAAEVRSVLDQITTLHQQSEAAAAEPEQNLAQLQAEYEREEQGRAQRRLQTLQSTARESWAKASRELQDDEKFPEFALRGDASHDSLVKEIQNRGQSEFGKFVKLWADMGGRELPSDVAAIMAKTFLLAQAAPVMALSRQDHYRRAEEVVASSKADSSYMRPQIGSSSGFGGNGSPAAKAPTSQDVGRMILEQIGVKGR